jgi:hypothetical protein
MWSILHCIIAIMVRQEILENVDTTDTLLDSSSPMNLKVKHQFLDQPVLTTSVSGGRDLNPDHKPLSTSGLGDFSRIERSHKVILRARHSTPGAVALLPSLIVLLSRTPFELYLLTIRSLSKTL